MKWTKVLLVIIIPVFIEILVSCCNCPAIRYSTYMHCSVEISNVDNSGERPILTKSDTIKKDSYGISASIKRSENICKIYKPQQSIFFQSAYATSCNCPPEFEYSARNRIIAINVVTLEDFDATHPANTDVSEYFMVYNFSKEDSINNYIKNLETTLYFVQEEDPLQFYLLLKTPPTSGSKQQFRVDISLSDESLLSMQTNLLELYD